MESPHVAQNPHNYLSRGWFWSSPKAIVFIKVSVVVATIFLLVQIYRWYRQSQPQNPFAKDSRVNRKPYTHDQRQRSEVLKQNFKV